MTPLTLAECFAWCDRYRATPWNALALATASDRQPSPMLVLGSFEFHARRTSDEAGASVPEGTPASDERSVDA